MNSESQWRYRAYRRGLRLVKYNRSSSAYTRYDPYALVDRSTKEVVAVNLHPDDLDGRLFGDSDQDTRHLAPP